MDIFSLISSRKMLTFLCAIFVVGLILLIGKLRRPNPSAQKCVHVVVLGDLGRSPRMCNHAMEFEKLKFNVQLVGYAGGCFSNQLFINQFDIF